jgi:hypothetical protein
MVIAPLPTIADLTVPYDVDLQWLGSQILDRFHQ